MKLTEETISDEVKPGYKFIQFIRLRQFVEYLLSEQVEDDYPIDYNEFCDETNGRYNWPHRWECILEKAREAIR